MKSCKKHDYVTSTTLTRLSEEHGVRPGKVKCFGNGEEWCSLVRTLCVQFVTWHLIFFHIVWDAHSSGASMMMTLFKPVTEQYMMIKWFDKEDASIKKKRVCKMVWWKNDQAEKVIWFDIRNIITCFSWREKERGGAKTKCVCIHISAVCVRLSRY